MKLIYPKRFIIPDYTLVACKAWKRIADIDSHDGIIHDPDYNIAGRILLACKFRGVILILDSGGKYTDTVVNVYSKGIDTLELV